MTMGKLNFKTSVTAEPRAWDQIYIGINSVSLVSRAPEEPKRKFAGLRTQVKRNAVAKVQVCHYLRQGKKSGVWLPPSSESSVRIPFSLDTFQQFSE